MPYEFYYSKWCSGRVKINASSAGVITKWVCISNRCCTAASQPQSEAQQVCTSIRIQPQKNCLHLWGEAGCYHLPCIVNLVPPCCLCFTPMSRHGHDLMCVCSVRQLQLQNGEWHNITELSMFLYMPRLLTARCLCWCCTEYIHVYKLVISSRCWCSSIRSCWVLLPTPFCKNGQMEHINSHAIYLSERIVCISGFSWISSLLKDLRKTEIILHCSGLVGSSSNFLISTPINTSAMHLYVIAVKRPRAKY